MPTFQITAPDGKTYEVTGPDGSTAEQALARVQSQVAPQEGSRARAAKQADGALTRAAANIIPGAIRGAGSIGATLMAPFDYAEQGIERAMGAPARETSINAQRRAGIDGGLQEMGADPTNPGYGAGKIATEVMGTLGAGPAVAAGAKALPVIGNSPRLLSAIGSGGMTAGKAAPGFVGGAANIGTRAAGGAVTGLASAGLVDPSQAGAGGAIGAALPVAAKVAGAAGNLTGRALRGPAQAPDLAAAVAAARNAGLVIPPSQANPTLVNRTLEGLAGKITTAQNASAKNSPVIADMVARDLGLPAGTKLTPQVLDDVRRQAGQAYQAVGSTGQVNAGQPYNAALDAIVAPFQKAAAGFPGAKPNPIIAEIDALRSPQFDAGAAIEKLKEVRAAADVAYGSKDKVAGKAYKDAAAAIEDALDRHLVSIGAPPDMLAQFRESRKMIAKTYTAQGATNVETGTVDARKLAAQLQRGKPLSGGMEEAARFAARFPKAAQPIEGMGSLPQTSPLDWVPSTLASLGTGNPLLMGGVLARPAARSMLLSNPVQNRLMQSPPNALAQFLANPTLQANLLRAGPVTLADR